MYSLVQDAEYLSDKSCDFHLSFIPEGYKLEVYDLFDYQLIPKANEICDSNVEDSNVIFDVNFKQDVA